MLKCYYPAVPPNSIVIVEQMCFLLPLCFVSSFKVSFPSRPSLYFFVQTDLSLWFTCGPLLLNPRSSGINSLQGSFFCFVFFQMLFFFFSLSGKLPDSCLFCCTHMGPINSQIPVKHRGDTTDAGFTETWPDKRWNSRFTSSRSSNDSCASLPSSLPSLTAC